MVTMHFARSSFIGIFALALASSVLADDEPKVPLPAIPGREFDIRSFGAVEGRDHLNTDAVASAIKAATSAGGGVVVIPKGTFLCGKIVLASKIELRLESGSTLLMTDSADAYRNSRGGFDDLISASKSSDVAITGSGTIDGQGQRWWDDFRKVKGTREQDALENHRPHLIDFKNCTRIRFEGITLVNSPSFHLVPKSCQDVTIRGVTFNAPDSAPNTDALDPSGWNYLITNCVFDVGDDCIAVKATGPSSPLRLACEDFYISKCTFLHGHGLSIGGQTPGGLRRMVVRDCTFDSTEAGIRMKANRGSGGVVEDVTYDGLTMKNVKIPIYITSYYPQPPKDPAKDPPQAANEKTPVWRNITIRNVRAIGSREVGRIIGLPEMRIGPIKFFNVQITAEKPLVLIWATDLSFNSSRIASKVKPSISSAESTYTGLESSIGK